ncbi:MAG: 6-phospho-beta-glucosidase [Blastocatellia bacterium]|nr:6-phospho-beta-glucosidase [Blastocatellia bacterium]MDW8256374.1 6-phospho-beta-glucosidase [Acidobacteriota bacterium]
MSRRKLTIIGGGGVRTPLLLYGLLEQQASLGLREVTLYDVERERVELMAALGQELLRQRDGTFALTVTDDLQEAVADAAAIITSIRVGGLRARARDERTAIEHGLVGQETTGVGGWAMALRTIPVVLEHARVIERVNPEAWILVFTNPAGVITQALTMQTRLRVLGICDTPSELFHRIARVLGEPPEDVVCDYFGLNHLGWVRAVFVRGRDEMARLLHDDEKLRRLYPADLFDPELIRALGLIPTEYLFFYYGHARALANQKRVGASRGEELEQLNERLFRDLKREIGTGRPEKAVAIYRAYLQRRSASYLRLEGQAESALRAELLEAEDPFAAATGYHRVALDVLTALWGTESRRLVLNVCNRGAIADLGPDDVVEVPCVVAREDVRPLALGRMPEVVRGLVLSVKAYERSVIRAAVERSAKWARLALLVHPLIGEWELADRLLAIFREQDPDYFGDFAP